MPPNRTRTTMQITISTSTCSNTTINCSSTSIESGTGTPPPPPYSEYSPATSRRLLKPSAAAADMFLLFYIKRRIESDGRFEWFEAPYCCDDDEAKIPPEWLLVEKAALIFEEDNRAEIEKTMIKRLEPIGKLNFRSFRMIVRHYLDQLSQRCDKSIALLSLLAFTGMYARRLAELDFQQAEKAGEDEDEAEKGLTMRNYRREIYQISIYGSRILLSQLDGKWDEFCSDIGQMMEQISSQEEEDEAQQKFSSLRQNRRPSFIMATGFPQLAAIGLPLMATVCGVGAAAYFLIRRCNQ